MNTTQKPMALTDDAGHCFMRPQRSDFDDVVMFIRAVHAYNDSVTAAANKAFDVRFRKALKEG